MAPLGPTEPATVAPRRTDDFATFFGEHYVRLCRGLFLITGDAAEAEDVAQEAMSRVYERWTRIASMDSPEGYLWRSALNLNHKRARRAAVRNRFTPTVPSGPDPAVIATTGVDVRAALAQLSPAHREVLILIDWFGLDAVAAAPALGIEPVSVRSRLHRARERMRELLEEEH